jgi:dienelactone hydrolase
VKLCRILALTCIVSVTSLAEDFSALRTEVDGLARLTEAPQVFDAGGFPDETGLKALFYAGLPWKGKPTRVFAWLGVPKSTEKLPGIVLIHGGGGTAYKEWVRKWNEHGFAAIAIAVEGQIDERNREGPPEILWKRHAFGGPPRIKIYGDSAEPLADQWMYHAVADTILANSLLRSQPEIDPKKIGLSGISWGGVITSTVMGIDRRFAFAIPIYGCGHLADATNFWGDALRENRMYREIWDPVLRIKNATLPALWLSWPGDIHFPLDCQAETYTAAPGPRMVALLPGMKHSHPAGWNPPDSYAFAEGIVRTGKPWLRQRDAIIAGDRITVSFASAKPLEKAVLIWTSDLGSTGERHWQEAAAALETRGETSVATATLPPSGTAWFMNVRSGALTGSSDFQVITRPER